MSGNQFVPQQDPYRRISVPYQYPTQPQYPQFYGLPPGTAATHPQAQQAAAAYGQPQPGVYPQHMPQGYSPAVQPYPQTYAQHQQYPYQPQPQSQSQSQPQPQSQTQPQSQSQPQPQSRQSPAPYMQNGVPQYNGTAAAAAAAAAYPQQQQQQQPFRPVPQQHHMYYENQSRSSSTHSSPSPAVNRSSVPGSATPVVPTTVAIQASTPSANTPGPVLATTPVPMPVTASVPMNSSTPVPMTANTPVPMAASTPVPMTASTPIPATASTPVPMAGSTPVPLKSATPAPQSATTPHVVVTTPKMQPPTPTPGPVSAPISTPTPGPVSVSTPTPVAAPETAASTIQRPPPKPLVRLRKDDNGNYIPKKRMKTTESSVKVLAKACQDADTLLPEFPLFQELGQVDFDALNMSIRSGINAEIRQALDKLTLITGNPNSILELRNHPNLVTGLAKLGLELLDELNGSRKHPGSKIGDEEIIIVPGIDDTEELFELFGGLREGEVVIEVDELTGEPVASNNSYANEVSNELEKQLLERDEIYRDLKTDSEPWNEYDRKGEKFGFLHYDELLNESKDEIEVLKKTVSSDDFWSNSLIDRFIAIMLIIRNLTFSDTNQQIMVNDKYVLKLILGLTKTIANNPDRFLNNHKRKLLSLQKNLIVIYANIGLHLVIPTLLDAFAILLLILSFSVDPNPVSEIGEVLFQPYRPANNKYTGIAIDAFAKLIPRDPPNHDLFRQLLSGQATTDENLSSDLSPMFLAARTRVSQSNSELLTSAFVMALSTLPRTDFRTNLPALEHRRPLIQQSLLVAETLLEFVSSGKSGNCSDIVHKWVHSREGVTHILFRAAFGLGAMHNSPFTKVARKCVKLLKQLGEKGLEKDLKSAGVPIMENILGALLVGNMDQSVVRVMSDYFEHGFEVMENNNKK